MIAMLSGRCVSVTADSLILDVHGVGYLLRCTATVLRQFAADRQMTVFVHTSVREDAIQLFGFANAVEQTVFERLTALQGVGPKVAMAVLSTLAPTDIRRASDVGDVALLQAVPGVGPKVARRIVTELSGKLDDVAPDTQVTLSATVGDGDQSALYEARAALVELGMSLTEAEAALATTDADADAASRIRQALRGGA